MANQQTYNQNENLISYLNQFLISLWTYTQSYLSTIPLACGSGSAALYLSGTATVVEIVAPALLPGVLMGPAGIIYAAVALGGIVTMNMYCEDPAKAIRKTVTALGITLTVLGGISDVFQTLILKYHSLPL